MLAVLLLASSPGCGADETPGLEGVVIGAVIDQSGSIARPAWRDAAFLAIDDANRGLERAGGYRGLRFSLAFGDSTNVAEVALRRAADLVRGARVKGLLTDTSRDSLALNATHYDADLDNDLGVPIVCMACTSPDLGNPLAVDVDAVIQRAERDLARWSFRTTADSDPETVALLNAAGGDGVRADRNRDGVWKISIYVSDDELGNSFFEGIQRARDRNFPLINPDGSIRQDGLRLEVVRHPPDIDANTYPWSYDIEKITDERNEDPFVNPGEECPPGTSCPGLTLDGVPDVIVEATFPLFAAAITKAYVEANISIPFIHSHNWRRDTTLLKLVTVDIENQQGVSHAVLDNCDTSGATFSDAMLAQTGKKPGLWDAQSYDGVMVMLLATLVAIREHDLEDPETMTGEQLRAAIFMINDTSADAVKVFSGPEEFAKAVEAIMVGKPIDYDGPSGPIDFDANGNVRNNFVAYVVQSNRFVDQLTFGCVADPDTCKTQTGACSP